MLAGCTPATLALPSTASWSEPETRADEVPVHPGEVLRIELSAPARIGERLRAAGTVETWRTLTPGADGAAYVRAGIGTTAFLVPTGSVRVGRTASPIHGWFDIEDRALDWAESGSGAFPDVGPAHRVDHSLLDALGKTTSTLARDDRDRDAARSIRRIAALRAIWALKPLTGTTWSEIETIAPDGSQPTKQIEDRDYWTVAPNVAMPIRITGPATLHLQLRSSRKHEDAVARLKVLEGSQVRATSTESIPASKGGESQDSIALRRLIVHVPPGAHTYALQADTEVFVRPLSMRHLRRVSDAIRARRDEGRELEIARRTCTTPANDALCAMARALAGEERAAVASESLDPAARWIAAALSSGGPHDPLSVLESRAAEGSSEAIAELGTFAKNSLDEGMREAWARTTARSSTWRGLDDAESAAEPWVATQQDPDSTCPTPEGGAKAAPTPTPIGTAEQSLPTSVFHGARAITLLATTPCDDKTPVMLDVDGEAVKAQPASPRALWHVVVKGGALTVRVKRTDSGRGQVLALPADSCHPSILRPPRLTTGRPELRWDPETAPGLEIWLREGEGQNRGKVEVTRGNEAMMIDVTAPDPAGLVAIDPSGARWRRSARVPLPEWVREGAVFAGEANVAVRRLIRSSRLAKALAQAPATPVEPAKVLELSRAIMAATDRAARGAAYAARGLELARGGFARAATEDARAAAELGARVDGQDPIAAINAALRRRVATSFEAAHAYGVEPDFDPNAARCEPHTDGARAKLASLSESLTSPRDRFDLATSMQAVEAALAAPDDPRGTTLVNRSFGASRWHILREADAQRVVRPREPRKASAAIVDNDGLLRAALVTGNPFEATPHAIVTADRPARASLSSARAKVRLEVVCAPRAPSSSPNAPCKVNATLGGAVIPITLDAQGRGSGTTNATGATGKAAELAITVDASPADHAALVRISFDKELPGAKNVPGVGWILDVPRVEHRFPVTHAKPLTATMKAPAIVRIDARAEPGAEPPELVALVDGREEPIRLKDESGQLIVATKTGRVSVVARKGAATITFAERVSRGKPDRPVVEDEEEDTASESGSGSTTGSAVVPVVAFDRSGTWRDAAERSPSPTDWLPARLGTLVATSGVWWGTLREGEPAFTAPDGHVQQLVTYRRRIESIGLTVAGTGIARFRDGAPTYGGMLALHERPDHSNWRINATAIALSQRIVGRDSVTIRPRADVQYVIPIARPFYLIPGVGFDGYYTNVPREPSSTRFVDDDVYNAFRFRHESLAHVQLTAWWVPYVDTILSMRVRGNMDVGSTVITHATVRPAALFVLGPIETSAFVDGALYPASPPRTSTTTELSAGAAIAGTMWPIAGSFGIRPGATSSIRANDGGWQLFAFVDILASFHRGVRDFAIAERPLPESLGGGVPWHGTPWGYSR